MSANKGLDALCSPNTVPFFYILLVSNLQPRQSCMDEKSFLFLTNHKIFTAAAIKKGAIKIFPCGNVVMLKEADVENKKSMSSKICVTVLKGKCIYQVLQPKADFNKKIGLISAFHWAQSVSSPEEATLELSEVKPLAFRTRSNWMQVCSSPFALLVLLVKKQWKMQWMVRTSPPSHGPLAIDLAEKHALVGKMHFACCFGLQVLSQLL